MKPRCPPLNGWRDHAIVSITMRGREVGHSKGPRGMLSVEIFCKGSPLQPESFHFVTYLSLLAKQPTHSKKFSPPAAASTGYIRPANPRKNICRKPVAPAAHFLITTMTDGWTFTSSTVANAISTILRGRYVMPCIATTATVRSPTLRSRPVLPAADMEWGWRSATMTAMDFLTFT